MIYDKNANEIIYTLNKNGYEAYYVGGCVRDALLGIKPCDFDITTSAKPEETSAIFRRAGYTVIETGIKHGTVSVIFDKKSYEVTTFRVDGKYSDSRHPESVEFVSSLKEDLARRDFTVNAMAYHPNTGIFDFFGGREDLKNKFIRCVGEPVKRFEEDALRILRALRFASRYDFTIEENTSNAIKQCKALLDNISAERIYSEFCGILINSSCAKFFRNYVDVFAVIIPEILPMVGFEQKSRWHIYDVFEHTMVALENTPDDLIVKLTVLFHDMGKPIVFTEDEQGFRHFKGHQKVSCEIAEKILRRLKADNKTRERVYTLVLHHDDRIPLDETAALRLIRRVGEDALRAIYVEKADNLGQNPVMVSKRYSELNELQKMVEKLIKNDEACIYLSDLAISGKDVIACGIKPGPRVGEILNILLEEVTEKRLPNEREALVDFIFRLF
ncbi:MAG: CCA tRNA nucleotidyltransferase [Clostridia bacterium]|nr:CCA tRNA nucleotidyltransferase [Clostridia bacterium]